MKCSLKSGRKSFRSTFPADGLPAIYLGGRKLDPIRVGPLLDNRDGL